MFSLRAVALSTCMLALGTANAAVSLLGVGSLPATATDLSGLTGTLESGVAKNLLSVGSGIAHTGQGSRFIVVPDRGLNANPSNAAVDDTTLFQARMHEIDLAITGSTVTPTITKTTLFNNEAGAPLTGLFSGFDTTSSSASICFTLKACVCCVTGRACLCQTNTARLSTSLIAARAAVCERLAYPPSSKSPHPIHGVRLKFLATSAAA